MPLNAAFTAATSLLGARLDPYHGFNFLIEIEGILTGGFTECSGLQVQVEVEPYVEGGLNDYTHHFKSRTTYPPLILKHGLTPLDGLWAWHQQVVHGTVNRLNGTIFLLNKMQIPLVWWNFMGAYPTKWTGPDLRAESSTVAFESIELVHQGLSQPAGSRLAAGLSVTISVGP